MLIEKAPDALPLDDVGGPVWRTLGPLGNLIVGAYALRRGGVWRW